MIIIFYLEVIIIGRTVEWDCCRSICLCRFWKAAYVGLVVLTKASFGLLGSQIADLCCGDRADERAPTCARSYIQSARFKRDIWAVIRTKVTRAAC